MKAGIACGLFLLLMTTGRAADVAKEVHDAVRDLLELKRYAWRQSLEVGSGTRVKLLPMGAGRTEVEGFTIGVFSWGLPAEINFTQFGSRTALRVESGWKEVESMDTDEIQQIFRRTVPRTRGTPPVPHWLFLPPHEALIAIVGTAPAPEWIGGRIVGIMALDEAAKLLPALTTLGQLNWEFPPPMVRSKLGGPPMPAPRPPLSEARLRELARRYPSPVQARSAQYELFVASGLISRLIIRIETVIVSREGAEVNPPTRQSWVFDFSEAGRVDVQPDPVVADLLKP
jgi:hypothetical protein